MNAAMAKARETVGDFLSRLQDPEASKEFLSLKTSFEEDGQVEHICLTEVNYADELFSGAVGNIPADISSLTLGQHVSIPLERVSDWMDIENGRLVGGYTLRVLRDKMSLEERTAFDEGLAFLVDESRWGGKVNKPEFQ